MDQKTKEIVENEVRQQIITAIRQAEREGQPVTELYAAVKAGNELSIRIENRRDGTCVLLISSDANA